MNSASATRYAVQPSSSKSSAFIRRCTVLGVRRRIISNSCRRSFGGAVHAFDETLSADELQNRIDLVPLLSGEQPPLADSAREDPLRHRYSYYTDDLVPLTWDHAFIYEPRGDSDVADVLEVANAQLLEMRYYDELLDTELPRMYDLVERAQRAVPLLASRRFANLARRLSAWWPR